MEDTGGSDRPEISAVGFEIVSEPTFEDQDPPGPPADEPSRHRPSRLQLTLVLTPLVVLTIAANLANAFFPTLVKESPVALIALDPRSRNLLLVVTQVSVVTFFGVSLLRRVLFDPLYFQLGRWYGDAAVRWLEKRSPDLGEMVGTIETWFPRWGRLLVAVYPHPLVIVLAGASPMSLFTFMAWNVLGNIVAIGLVWWAGDVFQGPLVGVTDFLRRWSVPLTVLSFAIAAVYFLRNRARGDAGYGSVASMQADLEKERSSDEGPPP